MIEDCIIVGGGVAGLSAANRLVDAGRTPLVIEAGHYPSHRICGEFLSPECLPILNQWEIPIHAFIQKCNFVSDKISTGFSLPIAAGSCSRFILDAKLQERAQNKGARFLTNSTVSFLNQTHNGYELTLSDGQIIKAQYLMLGTGRIPKINEVQKRLPPKYVGLKAHFKGIKNNRSVTMYCFEGGYLGISPIDAETTNIACIIKKENAPYFNINDLLKDFNARMLFPEWMTGELPEFGIRTNPNWERVFWIGDAAGSIPPISGDGLAIGITSGCMAADFFLNSNEQAFKKAWSKRYKRRFTWAQRLHALMLSPCLSKMAIRACKTVPILPPILWNLTREH